VRNAHNTFFDSKLSAICAQDVYFVHSTMPNVTCLLLSDVNVICRVTYLQFLIQACFSSRRHSGVLGLPNIWHKTSPTFGEVSCTERVVQIGNDFELITTVKWKLDIPSRDRLVVNFRRSIISVELWTTEVAIRLKFWDFFAFLEKRHLTVKFFHNSVPNVFIALPINVLCTNLVKFGRREIGKIVCCLPDKK